MALIKRLSLNLEALNDILNVELHPPTPKKKTLKECVTVSKPAFMKFFLARKGFVEKSCTGFHDIRVQAETQAEERKLSSHEAFFFTS